MSLFTVGFYLLMTGTTLLVLQIILGTRSIPLLIGDVLVTGIFLSCGVTVFFYAYLSNRNTETHNKKNS